MSFLNKNNDNNGRKNSKPALFVFAGVVFIIIFVSILNSSFGSNGSFGFVYFIVFFMIVVTFFWIVFSKSRFQMRNINRYNKYLFIIKNNPSGSIDYIAKSYPTTYEKCCTDLQYMIDSGMLKNAYLDLQKRKIFINGFNTDTTKGSTLNKASKSVKCSCCGATSRVYENEEGKCPYCGSALHY